MRDLIIALIIFGAVPFMLARPSIGAYMWCWFSYMNPHRLAYGWAYHYPFAVIISGATLLGTLFTKDRQRIPWSGITLLWLAWIVWMNLSTVFALVPDDAFTGWDRAMKIQLMTFVTLLVITTRERLQGLIWIIVLSIGFYAVKGGAFSILTMGQYKAWGPPESFIYDNNHLALEIVMIMPLWQYQRATTESWLLRLVCHGSMFISVFAVLASYSRGAFLAIAAMGMMLVLRSRAKVAVIVGILVMASVVLSFMPDEYYERMETIKTYAQDASAMGRINAWTFAWNLAVDHPFVGGGFNVFDPELFKTYAPNPEDFHDAHSIFFQVLAEHGFVGFGLFFGLFLAAFLAAGKIRRQTRDREDLKWAFDLGSMLQICIAGYDVGGAFLSLAYFDLPYHLVAMTVLARLLVERHLAEVPEPVVAMKEDTSMMPDDAEVAR